jgi:hypothetical protein
MTRALSAWGFRLHRARRWLQPLLAVVAAGSLAYSVEVLITSGWSQAGGLAWLLLTGLAASSVLAWIMAYDVFAAWESGVLLHVAILGQEKWRRRHEMEQELLRVQAREASSYASTTALSTEVAPTRDTRASEAAAARAVSALLDSAGIGAALLPGARDLRILAAGDIPTLAVLGFRVQPHLSQWRTHLLVDRSYEPGASFAELQIAPQPATRDRDCHVLVLVGDRLDRGPATKWLHSSGQEHQLVQAGDLPEEPSAYEQVLQQIAGAVATTGRVTTGVGGPAVFGFAAGWLASASGAGALHALWPPARDEGYSPGPEAIRDGPDQVAPLPSSGIRGRLLAASALLAATSTLAFGSCATLLEWWLAGSNSEGPISDWLWLIVGGIVLPAAVAWFGLRPWVDRLTRPDVLVRLLPGSATSRKGELVVAPRTPPADTAACVGWLREAMADIRSIRPGSRVVIDLDNAPDELLRPLGSFLNRGHRGSDLMLRSGSRDYPLIRTDEGPDAVQDVRHGYRHALRFAASWESAS